MNTLPLMAKPPSKRASKATLVVAQNVKRLMSSRDLSHKAIERATGGEVSASAVGYLLKYHDAQDRHPTTSTIEGIGRVFGVEPWELMVPAERLMAQELLEDPIAAEQRYDEIISRRLIVMPAEPTQQSAARGGALDSDMLATAYRLLHEALDKRDMELAPEGVGEVLAKAYEALRVGRSIASASEVVDGFLSRFTPSDREVGSNGSRRASKAATRGSTEKVRAAKKAKKATT